jgi:capsular polysaccharide biosynthesis protein
MLITRLRLIGSKTKILCKSLGRTEELKITTSTDLTNSSIIFFPVSGERFITEISKIHFTSDFTELGNTHKSSQIFSSQIFAFRIDYVDIRGNTNFFSKDGFAFFPNEYIPKTEVLPFEMNGLGNVNFNKLTLIIANTRSINIESGVNLLGSASGNYAHWLLEILPKALLIESYLDSDNIPFLVDEWVHPNMLESLRLLVNPNRNVIRIRRWAKYHVNVLYDARIGTYIPAESRLYFFTKVKPPITQSWYTLNSNAIDLVKVAAQKILASPTRDMPKKIFLDRSPRTSGNARFISNIQELKSIAKQEGYTIIDPGTLSFFEQMHLFSEATHVISPIGAGLVNLLFTKPGAKVIGLAPYLLNGNYYFFHQLVSILSHDFKYILGEPDNYGHHDQINFTINPVTYKLLITK